MSEDLFTKAMAKAYELHPCAQASSNFCWYLFKAGSETKDAEIKRLIAEVDKWKALAFTAVDTTRTGGDQK